jgi:CRISPR-associated protein Csm3
MVDLRSPTGYPDQETIEMWENIDSELQYTELKPENSIDRITSEANPRFLERVVKGSNFDVEFVFSIYDWEDGGEADIANLGRVFEALRLLEHSGIGGNVSRGYGRVEFKLFDPIVVYQEDYRDKNKFEEKQSKEELKSLSEIEIPEIKTEA